MAASRSVACYKRTLDHLKAWSFKLPSHLRVASIKFDETERTHDGLRLFTYQHLPQIKFHNPTVNFLVSARSPNCTVEFVGNGDEAGVLDVNEKSHKEIKDLIEGLYPQTTTDTLTDNDNDCIT